jgi:hypothetical protein
MVLANDWLRLRVGIQHDNFVVCIPWYPGPLNPRSGGYDDFIMSLDLRIGKCGYQSRDDSTLLSMPGRKHGYNYIEVMTAFICINNTIMREPLIAGLM